MTDPYIMLVEDNPDDEALTRRALKQRGVTSEVVTAHDGAEALDYLLGNGQHAGRDLREQPQVVFLDLKLPKIDGLQVLQCLRANERTRTLPVVVLSSSDEDHDLESSYQCGANSYVRKPVAFAQFAEAICQVGMYWLLLNQLPRAR
jgi:two-component system, response regulator